MSLAQLELIHLDKEVELYGWLMFTAQDMSHLYQNAPTRDGELSVDVITLKMLVSSVLVREY